MTRRRRIALCCLGAGLLAAWALYPRVDSRFVGSWKLDYEALPFHLGRDGVRTATVMSQGLIAGPNGTVAVSNPAPSTVYQRWRLKDDKLIFGEAGEPSIAWMAVYTTLDYLGIDVEVEHEEYTIVSVSPDEIILKSEWGGDVPIHMFRQKTGE